MLNQVDWGAVFAGAALALVMQIILNMIGLGVGLSTLDVAQGDTPSVGSMSVGAGVWFVVSGILAAALGGYIAGRLSGKASSSTTAYHGLMLARSLLRSRPEQACDEDTLSASERELPDHQLRVNVPRDLLEDAYRTRRESALRGLSGSQPRYLEDFTEADSGSLARHS